MDQGAQVRLIRGVLAVALLAAMAVPAAAQTSGKFKFISGNPYGNPTLAVNGSSYYTSIYRGQFLSGGPTTAQLDIFCVDFFHRVSPGNEWDAWFSPLSGDLSKTYGMQFRGWSQSIAAERYRAAAWMATQFGSPVGGYDAAEKANWPSLQAAIWSLMGQNVAGTSTAFPLALNSTQQGWLNTALSAGNTAEFQAQAGNWTVISDMSATATTGKQEFLVQQSVVPEPETVILLVTGLLAIGAVAYFRGFSA
jgi:hypothetical protein